MCTFFLVAIWPLSFGISLCQHFWKRYFLFGAVHGTAQLLHNHHSSVHGPQLPKMKLDRKNNKRQEEIKS